MKLIQGYGEKYYATELGNIININTGKEIKGYPDKDGYLKISLTVSRKEVYTRRRSRLVAMAWLPNPDNLPVVNHKNGIKDDDRVSNLEWCTASYNTQHGWDTGLIKPYDRSQPYNRQGIIDSNKRRSKSVSNYGTD